MPTKVKTGYPKQNFSYPTSFQSNRKTDKENAVNLPKIIKKQELAEIIQQTAKKFLSAPLSKSNEKSENSRKITTNLQKIEYHLSCILLPNHQFYIFYTQKENQKNYADSTSY